MTSLRFLLVLSVGLCGVQSAELYASTTRSKSKTAAPSAPLPEFSDVVSAVQEQLATRPDYQQGDLLTASTVKPIFARLEKIHWKVADRQQILRSVLPDSDFMARQLSTRRGRKFMREIAALPGGYDRVDHFRRMPYGQNRLEILIQNPDGNKLFEYMTTTRNGKTLGRMVTAGQNGRDFDKPTGRIYTELDLIKRLKKSYDAEAVRRMSIEAKKKQKEAKKEPPAPPQVPPPSTTPPPVINDPFDTIPGK